MHTLDTLLPILRTAKQELMTRYPITEMAVFGSYARGEADADSDLDVLYVMDFDQQSCSLFDIIDIKDFITEKTGIQQIDLMSKRRLKPFLAPRILGEARTL